VDVYSLPSSSNYINQHTTLNRQQSKTFQAGIGLLGLETGLDLGLSLEVNESINQSNLYAFFVLVSHAW